MAEYPTQEQQADPTYVWPLEYAAPQDRGESAPAANPSPGVNSVTEPAVETKEFVDTSPNLADIFDHEDSANFDGVDRTGSAKGVTVDEPASKGGGVEVQGAARKGK
jgi:hypothetical protein